MCMVVEASFDYQTRQNFEQSGHQYMSTVNHYTLVAEGPIMDVNGQFT